MKRIGICGSDLHVYHGKHPLTTYPVVQGHEVSGAIEAVGKGVRGLGVGDPVTLQPQVTCGKCYACRHGAYHICDHLKVMGFQTTGAASEYFAVDATKVLPLPRSLSFEHGAMMEPLAVAVHALERGGGAAGKAVLVLGAGPIGNLVAQTARALGATHVMVTDLSDRRLEMARACGIEGAVNPGTGDLESALERHFGPDRADLILECVGSPRTAQTAVAVARKGTDIVIVGVFGEIPPVDLATVQDRELRLVGTLMYREPDWRTAIELAAGGKVALEPLITDHFAFHEYEAAYRHIDAHREQVMKVMIEVDA
jgi:L-iditol 2-dehydrogenase